MNGSRFSGFPWARPWIARARHILLSNRFYRAILRPFDKIHFPVVGTQEITAERLAGRIVFNKVPHLADVDHPGWHASSRDLGEHYWCLERQHFHRKLWEYNQILHSLRRARRLAPQAVALSVGAGHEPPLYFLTHKIARVVGIDLYDSAFLGGEDDRDTVESIEKYAPYPFHPKKLELRRMDARRLEFADNTFDFVFSISSIEHFGSNRDIGRSIAEVYRVLKPGGLYVFTTELKLNRLGCDIPGTHIFTLPELLALFHQAGFTLYGDGPDLRLERESLAEMTKLPDEALRRPHIILRQFRTIFTSIHLVMQKAGADAVEGDEVPVEIPRFRYDAGITVRLDPAAAAPGQEVTADVQLENRCDFAWFCAGMSHRIAMAVKLLDSSDTIIDENYCDHALPRNVGRGETLRFSFPIRAPQTPGEYRLLFDLKKELITWFFEKGSQTCQVALRVLPATEKGTD